MTHEIRNIDNGKLEPHARKAFDELVAIDAPVYNHDEESGEHFILGAELRDGDDHLFADYYQEEVHEYLDDDSGNIINAFGIREDVRLILDKHNLFGEWINPGQVGIYNGY